MGKKVAVVRPRTWQEAREVGSQLSGWSFRGQASHEWDLSSSLERASNAVDAPLYFLGNREYVMRTQFMRRAHHYLDNTPAPDRHVEWLSLMQHHGAPTRLLDFTRSFYASAFFALENATGDSAIWAVNMNLLEEFAKKKLEIGFSGSDTILDVYRQFTAVADKVIEEQQGPAYVLPVEPMRLNERMSIQQGVFLMGCDIKKPFMTNLSVSVQSTTMPDEVPHNITPEQVDVLSVADYALLKIQLPHKIREEAIRDLQSMNVTAATLFPGLDGFARSLRSLVTAGDLTNERLRKAGIDPANPSGLGTDPPSG